MNLSTRGHLEYVNIRIYQWDPAISADRLSFFLDEFAKGYVEFRLRSGLALNLLMGRIDTRRLKASDMTKTPEHE